MWDKLVEWTGSAIVGAVLLWLYQQITGPARRGFERRKARQAFTDTSDAFDHARSAALLTVGLRKGSQPIVLARLKPGQAAFLCSEQGCGVVDEILADGGTPSNLKADGVTRRFTCDPDNVEDIRRAATDALDWLEATGASMAATLLDITGGTAVMTVGAYDVARARGVDTMYVYSQYDHKRTPIAGTQRGVYVARSSGST